jgi:hypothetical protein
MSVRSAHLKIVGLALIPGVLLASFMSYAALSDNPQGQFYEASTHTLHVGELSVIFFSWLIPAFLVVAVPIYLARFALGRVVRVTGKPPGAA